MLEALYQFRTIRYCKMLNSQENNQKKEKYFLVFVDRPGTKAAQMYTIYTHNNRELFRIKETFIFCWICFHFIRLDH